VVGEINRQGQDARDEKAALIPGPGHGRACGHQGGRQNGCPNAAAVPSAGFKVSVQAAYQHGVAGAYYVFLACAPPGNRSP